MTQDAVPRDDGPGPPLGTAPNASLHAALGQAYVEMVRLYRAGASVEALAIRDLIQTQLGGLVERTYRGAVEHAARGRTTEAFIEFTQAIELHRTNLAN